jgi:hypothetical protein
MLRLIKEPTYLDDILSNGRGKALSIASNTLKDVHKKMGFLNLD